MSTDTVRVVTGTELRAKKAALLRRWPRFAEVERRCCEGHMEDDAAAVYGDAAGVRDGWRSFRNVLWLLGEERG